MTALSSPQLLPQCFLPIAAVGVVGARRLSATEAAAR